MIVLVQTAPHRLVDSQLTINGRRSWIREGTSVPQMGQSHFRYRHSWLPVGLRGEAVALPEYASAEDFYGREKKGSFQNAISGGLGVATTSINQIAKLSDAMKRN